jgi:peptidoglycan hydrolase CwlO-like protein
MPRGTSKPTDVIISELEQKKAGLQSKVDNYKSRISEIDSKIQSIHISKTQKEVERVIEAIKSTGRSVDDFITSFIGNDDNTTRPAT